MSVEKLYTLAEARLELNREECKRMGHDFEIVIAAGYGNPTAVLCARCGMSWAMEKDQWAVAIPHPGPE